MSQTPEVGQDAGFQDADAELEQAGRAPDGADQPTAAPAGSELASLRQRVAQAKRTFDLEVPRVDPPVFVRYEAVPQWQIEETLTRTAKLPRRDRTVMTNAILLAKACRGVFELDQDGREVSVDPEDRDGDWPCFDARLARLLGLSTTKSTDVVRALYGGPGLGDGDLISTAQDLFQRSGYSQEQTERESEGN